MHLLLLTDRDWTHPEAGGTGTTLRALVSRWIDEGNRVTMIAGSYEGALAWEQPRPGLEIHRMGTRLTVFPRAALARRRGVGRDADVVLEVINGIAFFTPLWFFMRTPRVVLLQHVHQQHYVLELGLLGRVAGFLLERLPLRYLYHHATICAISQSVRDDLVKLGVAEEGIRVVYLGVADVHGTYPRARRPTILYLGRLKRYKRVEVLLDVLEACPDAVLEVAGDGDHRAAFEAEVRRRGLEQRVVMHGFVPERSKPELYGRAWVMVTASGAEGWGHTVMEAAVCGTSSAALRVGGLAEAIVDGDTGVVADTPRELTERVSELMVSEQLRDQLGAAAAKRARFFTWDRTAAEILEMLRTAAAVGEREPMALPQQTPELVPVAVSSTANGSTPQVDATPFVRLLGRGWRPPGRRTGIASEPDLTAALEPGDSSEPASARRSPP